MVENGGGKKMTKNQRRRMQKKAKKHASKMAETVEAEKEEKQDEEDTPQVEIEYVSADLSKEIAQDDPAFEEFAKIFEKFSSAEELCGQRDAEDSEDFEQDDDTQQHAQDEEQDEEEQHLSNKVRRKMKRLSVAELKQLVARPDVVEAHDVTSADPKLLVYLKAYRNTVPVPIHWCQKRKYLQGKRGVEKHPFILPDYIARTGIADVRGAAIEEEERKKSKQKTRDRVQPKMGRVDIDYQVLHDAFFRYQTKPKFTILGDLYYEGKEFEVKMKKKTPGILSDELKKALGMSDGVPPPWLLHMQRYGPPPSYPNLKIPGLNAPIPEGSSFGYHPGGWGKPPVDESGRPLYGDVFAKQAEDAAEDDDPNIQREPWGKIEEVQYEESEEDEESEEEQEQQVLAQDGMETPMLRDGISSVVSGLETPATVDLRKDTRGTETPSEQETATQPQPLYTILKESKTAVGGDLYGSSHGYVVPGDNNEEEEQDAGRKRKADVPVREKSKKYKDFKF